MNESGKRIIDGAEWILHGGDYNPDQWLDRPYIEDADFRMMKSAGCNTFTLGVFSWTSYEPEEGLYCFDWLSRIMDRMAGEGYRIILATPSGAKPAWMAELYPEIRRVNRQGLREPQQIRHNHCWSSPVYRRKVRELNTALAERFKNHPALGMWHISNEYSGFCYCDLCLDAFRRWLQEKYGTLEVLNERWWNSFWNHTFTCWSQIDPRDESIDALQTDWNRFNTDQIIGFYQAEREPLDRICPQIPKTTNLMGFHKGTDYWKLVKVMDVISNDSYPCLNRNNPELWKEAADLAMVHDFLRTASRSSGRPWLMMEMSPSCIQWKASGLKAPGLHRAEALSAIAHGAEGILYFQWRKGAGGYEKFHGAVVDHEGTELPRVFQETSALGRELASMTEILGSQVGAGAAIVYDWESRWILRDSCGTLSHPATGGNDAGYRPQTQYRELWRRSIATDVISPEHDFSPYRLLIIPQLFRLDPDTARKLSDYVAAGGILVGTWYTGYVDGNGVCLSGGWPGNGLREVFGIWNEEYDLLAPGGSKTVRFSDGTETEGSGLCEMIHAKGAEVLAEYAEDFYAGRPAVTRNSFGKGQAFYIATELGASGMQSVYDRAIAAAGLLAPAVVAHKPDSVSVRVRACSGTGTRFVFITNWSARATGLELAAGARIAPFGGGAEMAGTVNLEAFGCACGRLTGGGRDA